jgi:hypothetical protein
MGIKRLSSDIDNYIDAKIKRAEDVLINALEYVAIECQNEARNNGSYQDQTGNLRSSVGYVIVRNGEVVKKSKFPIVKNGSYGQKEGLSLSARLALEYRDGIALIVVAGMNYAAYVETSRNVLTSSELLAERLVPKMLKDLGFR